jgi:hypothetical protein
MPFTTQELTLLTKAADALKYAPYIYREIVLAANTNPSVHFVKHKVGLIDQHTVFYFIPTGSDSRNNFDNLQFVSLLQPSEGFDSTSVNNKLYKVMIEKSLVNNTVVVTQAKAKELKANKLYMLRAISSDELIIINYNVDEQLNTNYLIATDAEFMTMPKVNINGTLYSLVKEADLITLAARVTALENKIIVNTIAPESALSGASADTLYVKVDEYGSSED